MPTAYILVFCEPGSEAAVVDELRTIPSVVEAATIYGSSYDIIVKVSSDTTSELNKIISNSIRSVKNVKSTQTMTVIEKDKEN